MKKHQKLERKCMKNKQRPKDLTGKDFLTRV
jgi:hypothetical protein